MAEYILVDDEDDDDVRNAVVRVNRPPARRPSRSLAVRTTARRAPIASPTRTGGEGVSKGLLIASAIEGLAALSPLPQPPVATGDAKIDLGNVILYQDAIAKHNHRQEQLQTLGRLIGRFVA